MNLNYPKESLLSSGNIITLQDNTLVYFNTSKLSSDDKTVEINALHNDGNITSFIFKCPIGSSFRESFSRPLISNYMVIVCNKDNDNAYEYNGMIVRSDGIVIRENIPISLYTIPLYVWKDFKLFVDDNNHMFWIVMGVDPVDNHNATFFYAYFDLSITEEGIINIQRKWDGTYSYFTSEDSTFYGYDIVFTPFKEYMIVHQMITNSISSLYHTYLKPGNNSFQDNDYANSMDVDPNTIRSDMEINCKIDSTYQNVCYCLIYSNGRNSLTWASFAYNGSYGTSEWTSTAYPLYLSNGYHDLSVISIKQNSGFLIFGYEDKTEKFTAFILNVTYSANQAYSPGYEGSYYRNKFNNSPVKVNTFYQEFYIDTGILDKSLISNNYHNLLSNNTLILGYHELWSAELTPILENGEYMTQIVMSNDKSKFPPNAVIIPSNNAVLHDFDLKTINIAFYRPVLLYNNNITIYQVDNSKRFLRQRFTINSKFINTYENNTVVLNIIDNAFNIPGANYSLEIDNEFFNYSTSIKGLVFPSGLSLEYNTESKEYIYAGKASAILRLTEDGTNLFESYNSNDKKLFLKNLTQELVDGIPLNDPSQIEINSNYEIDKTILNRRQLLLSLSINPPANKNNNMNVEQIIRSLDSMIRNSDVSSLSLNSYTKYLDNSYGSIMNNNLWDKYKYILIGIACAGIILIGLFFLARKKCKEGNNLIIFKVALLSSDMVTDFLFAINDSRNVEILHIPSIIFLVVPIITNLILVFIIFITECMDNKRYFIWFKNNSQPAAIITILCGGDITVLKLLSSNLAGFELFNAPLSKKAEKFIYYGGILNTFIEDLPQLIIQIIYNNKTITYDFIPLISLTTGSIILSSTILGHIYNIIIKIYIKMKGGDNVNKSFVNNLDEDEECKDVNCEHELICKKCGLQS